VFLRKDRPAIGRTALAVLVIVVVIVGGAIGISFPKSGQKAAASSTTSSSSASLTSSTTAASSSASSSSSSVSSSTTTSLTPTAPLFNFTLTTSPSTVLIAPGQTLNYSSVYLIPRPNTLEGNALLNAGIGSELVVLNATVPNGMYIHFFGSTLINRIYEEAGAGSVSDTEMQLVAPQNIAPGNYTVTIEGSSGSLSVSYSFTVQVVKYLVIAQFQTFGPSSLNVTVGTTVYWINLSTDKNMPYDVVFTTINVHSDTLNPDPAFDSFSYTFTTPGVYPYYCAYASTMKGTITVTS
jgi:plastocyanin